MSTTGFDGLISKWWKLALVFEDAATNIVRKLSFLRAKLKVGNKTHNGNIIQKKNEVRKKASMAGLL
ncbi:hypothetical protein COCNU_13G006830 [Cocos nucifera]|uniref:Uncharacterized protein n=1 Tax=Cocos nucifera TaxID=13894 RepID=A0A8K0IU24_COCNU|nr:hypothetical protein COCNU_13G006830 [Cocos nucifera]